MAVGRDFADGIALVIRVDGLHPLGVVSTEIFLLEISSRLLGEGHDLLHQFAAIVALAIGSRQLLQGVGVLGPAEDVSRPVGGAVLLHKCLPPVGVGGAVLLHGGGDALGILGPLGLHIHLYRHALPGGGNGRGEQLRQGPGAEAAVELRPASGSPRNHGGNPARLGHFRKALSLYNIC